MRRPLPVPVPVLVAASGVLAGALLLACSASRNPSPTASAGEVMDPDAPTHPPLSAADSGPVSLAPPADSSTGQYPLPDAAVSQEGGSDAGVDAGRAWTAATFAEHGVRGFNDPSDIGDQSMSEMAATGANVVRYFLELSTNTGELESDGITAGPSATSYVMPDLAGLASLVSAASTYGFKVVIVPDGPKFGLGAPNAASLVESLASIWATVATRYDGHPAIAGYDLFNEPVLVNGNVQAGQTQWIAEATTLIEAIRAADADHAIIFEPTPWALGESFSTTLATPLPFDNIVYSLHDYGPQTITAQGIGTWTTPETYPSPASADIGAVDLANLATQQGLSGVITFQNQFNVPIYVGEFSCVRWAPVAPSNSLPTAYNWVADTIPLFEAQGWSWNYHDWRGYYGWDPDVPESFFYQFPYQDGQPEVPGTYDTGGATNAAVGSIRSSTTDTMLLLKSYFQRNR